MTTAVSPPLPSRATVRGLLEDLVGRPVQLRDADPVSATAGAVVAVYVTDLLAMSAVVAVDLPGAARMGGALGLLPPRGVDDAIDDGRLSGMLRENCYEVLNVLAAAFNRPDAPHVRLYEMYGPDASLPSDVAALAQTFGQRLDVMLTISGYGDVHLSVVVR